MSRVEPNTGDTSLASGRPAPYLLRREPDVHGGRGRRAARARHLLGGRVPGSLESLAPGRLAAEVQLRADVARHPDHPASRGRGAHARAALEGAPDIVVECGVAHGGALVLYASVLELLGKGHVVGVDVEIRKYNRLAIESHALSHRITLIEGDSVAASTLERCAPTSGREIGYSSCSTPFTLASTSRRARGICAARLSRRATSSSSTESCPWSPTLRTQGSTGRPTTRSSP